MASIISPNSALLIINVQMGFDDPKWGKRNNPNAELKISELLSFWRDKSQPIIHIQHCSDEPNSPLRPNQPGAEFKPAVRPIVGEPIFQKSVNSAFIGTELELFLRDNQIDHLVVVGLTTDHCVSTTTRMAGNLGFQVFLVADATATFNRKGPNGQAYSAEEIHAVHLASLHNEFCTVVTAASLIPE